MTHFLGIYHGNCALRYAGGVLEVKKLDFRGVKGQFDAKKANFRGPIAKFGYCRPILASTYGPFSWNMPWEVCPKVCWRGFRFQKVRFWGLIGQNDIKMANFSGLIAKIGHYRPILLLEPTYGPFSWNMSWELCPKVCWMGSRAQKVRF